MAHLDDLGDLQPEDWEDLQTCLDRFETAWKRAIEHDQAEPEIENYLPPHESELRKRVLYELVKTDLESRWKYGKQPPNLDWYLQKCPELGTAQTLSPNLVYEEYRIRVKHGQQVKLTEYQRRFPLQFTDLQQLIEGQPTTFPTPPVAFSTGGKAPSGHSLMMAPGPGTKFRNYELIEELGQGAFAAVWKAKSLDSGKLVAFKYFFKPGNSSDVERERKSLELTKSLGHPFLLQVHEFFIENRQLFVVMELASGGTMKARLETCKKQGLRGIPAPELVKYWLNLAEALDYLHDKDIQHRDIKPANILLVDGGYAKLADFGLAREMSGEASMVNTSGGTMAYQAPEMFKGELVRRKSDQYCFACTYAELWLGRLPFNCKGPIELMNAHLTEMPKLDPMPKPEQDVLLRALSKKPQDRFDSCKQFVKQLERALEAADEKKKPELLPNRNSPPPVKKTDAIRRPVKPPPAPALPPARSPTADLDATEKKQTPAHPANSGETIVPAKRPSAGSTATPQLGNPSPMEATPHHEPDDPRTQRGQKVTMPEIKLDEPKPASQWRPRDSTKKPVPQPPTGSWRAVLGGVGLLLLMGALALAAIALLTPSPEEFAGQHQKLIAENQFKEAHELAEQWSGKTPEAKELDNAAKPRWLAFARDKTKGNDQQGLQELSAFHKAYPNDKLDFADAMMALQKLLGNDDYKTAIDHAKKWTNAFGKPFEEITENGKRQWLTFAGEQLKPEDPTSLRELKAFRELFPRELFPNEKLTGNAIQKLAALVESAIAQKDVREVESVASLLPEATLCAAAKRLVGDVLKNKESASRLQDAQAMLAIAEALPGFPQECAVNLKKDFDNKTSNPVIAEKPKDKKVPDQPKNNNVAGQLAATWAAYEKGDLADCREKLKALQNNNPSLDATTRREAHAIDALLQVKEGNPRLLVQALTDPNEPPLIALVSKMLTALADNQDRDCTLTRDELKLLGGARNVAPAATAAPFNRLVDKFIQTKVAAWPGEWETDKDFWDDKAPTAWVLAFKVESSIESKKGKGEWGETLAALQKQLDLSKVKEEDQKYARYVAALAWGESGDFDTGAKLLAPFPDLETYSVWERRERAARILRESARKTGNSTLAQFFTNPHEAYKRLKLVQGIYESAKPPQTMPTAYRIDLVLAAGGVRSSDGLDRQEAEKIWADPEFVPEPAVCYPLMVAYAVLQEKEAKLQAYCDIVAVLDANAGRPTLPFYKALAKNAAGKLLSPAPLALYTEVLEEGIKAGRALSSTKNLAFLLASEARLMEEFKAEKWPVKPLVRAHELYAEAYDLDGSADRLYDKAKSRVALPMSREDWTEVEKWSKDAAKKLDGQAKYLLLSAWTTERLGNLEQVNRVKLLTEPDKKLAYYKASAKALDRAMENSKDIDTSLKVDLLLESGKVAMDLGNFYNAIRDTSGLKTIYNVEKQREAQYSSAARFAKDARKAALQLGPEKAAERRRFEIRALELFADAKEHLAYMYVGKSEEYKEAEEAFSEAIESESLKSMEATTWTGRGRVQYWRSWYGLKDAGSQKEVKKELLRKAAVEDLEMAVKLAGPSLDALEPLLLLKTIYSENDEARKSVACYEQAFKIYTDFRDRDAKSALDVAVAKSAADAIAGVFNHEKNDAMKNKYADMMLALDPNRSAQMFYEITFLSVDKLPKGYETQKERGERLKKENRARLLKDMENVSPKETMAVLYLCSTRMNVFFKVNEFGKSRLPIEDKDLKIELIRDRLKAAIKVAPRDEIKGDEIKVDLLFAAVHAFFDEVPPTFAIECYEKGIRLLQDQFKVDGNKVAMKQFKDYADYYVFKVQEVLNTEADQKAKDAWLVRAERTLDIAKEIAPVDVVKELEKTKDALRKGQVNKK